MSLFVALVFFLKYKYGRDENSFVVRREKKINSFVEELYFFK